jgi:hypothetical protein
MPCSTTHFGSLDDTLGMPICSESLPAACLEQSETICGAMQVTLTMSKWACRMCRQVTHRLLPDCSRLLPDCSGSLTEIGRSADCSQTALAIYRLLWQSTDYSQIAFGILQTALRLLRVIYRLIYRLIQKYIDLWS